MPHVIYCHGNCSSRLDALPVVSALMPDICVVTFDFSGSGHSEGEYVSLGWFEKDDIKAIVDYLRESGQCSSVGLWGRSMGAVSSIMYCASDPLIAGMVLDSPFSSLKKLTEELCRRHSKIPLFICRLALKLIRKTIKKKVKFDIFDLDTTKFAAQCYSPAVIGFGAQDAFVAPSHGKTVANHYAGDYNYLEVEGDHNSVRPSFFYDSAGIFFYNALQVEWTMKASADKVPQFDKTCFKQLSQVLKGGEDHAGLIDFDECIKDYEWAMEKKEK